MWTIGVSAWLCVCGIHCVVSVSLVDKKGGEIRVISHKGGISLFKYHTCSHLEEVSREARGLDGEEVKLTLLIALSEDVFLQKKKYRCGG